MTGTDLLAQWGSTWHRDVPYKARKEDNNTRKGKGMKAKSCKIWELYPAQG
jgi:hypothetical protein